METDTERPRLLPLQTSRRRHDGLVTSRTIKRTQTGTHSPQCYSAVTCGVCVIPRKFNYFKGARRWLGHWIGKHK